MFDFTTDSRPKLSVKDIVVPSGRARQNFSHVLELKDSIEKCGLIHPVVVSRRADGKWDLMAGESRFKACLLIPQMGGVIPFTPFDTLDELRQKEIEYEENARRKKLEVVEEIENLRQLDELKKKLYGIQTRDNPEGWSRKKTAELAGIDAGEVSRQINLAKTLKERPDLKQRVANLPLTAMLRVVEQIKQSEKVERLVSSGEIELTHELHHSDCRTWLKSVPSDSVDLILTDPPFGVTEIENKRGGGADAQSSYQNQLKDADNLTVDSTLKLMGEVVPELFRVLRPSRHIYIFWDMELFGELKTLLQSAGFIIQWPPIIWDKGRTTSPFNGYRFAPMYEVVVFAYKPGDAAAPVRRLSESVAAIQRFSPVAAKNKLHVFEKPPELLEKLIAVSSTFGEMVVDPFAGSGSALLVAKQMGRKAAGCELDREHFLLAQERLLKSPLPTEVSK